MKKIVYLTLLVCIMGLAGCGLNPQAVPGEDVSADGETTDAISGDEVSENQVSAEEAVAEESTTSNRSHRGGSMAVEATPDVPLNYQGISVTSENVSDGVWDVAVKDNSPQLSWEAVEGAEGYVIYMLDVTAGNWMHMCYTTTETSLEPGEDAGYVGPYPPAGSTHEYVMYVVALQDMVEELPGDMDRGNYVGMPGFLQTMNTSEEVPEGNVIGYGELSGMYTPQ